MTRPCPSCRSNRAAHQYLCRGCWFALTPTARAALNRPGPGAIRRVQALYDQLVRGVPLADMVIPDV